MTAEPTSIHIDYQRGQTAGVLERLNEVGATDISLLKSPDSDFRTVNASLTSPKQYTELLRSGFFLLPGKLATAEHS